MGGIRSLFGRLKERLLLPHAVRAEFRRVHHTLEMMERRIERAQEALGRIEGRQMDDGDDAPLQEREFRVFSQWGEDGIVRHLTQVVPIERPFFVEFGVEAYHEANTRFLLTDANWSGLVLDSDAHAIDRIRRSRIHWLHDLTAVQAWLTRENVDEALSTHGAEGPIGLLSIDVDGMDYWIWDAIECVSPAIVIAEYNFRFGREASVTVPYAPDFDRRRAHPSLLYYGASLTALARLGARKGYDLIGCGSAGLNAFFVRRDLRPASLPALSAHDAWLEGRFHETHEDGGRVKRTAAEQAALVQSLPLQEVGPDGWAHERGSTA